MIPKPELQVLQFLKSFGPFCLAVTINFKQGRFDGRQFDNRYWAERDAIYFCNMLNSLFFKRAFKYGHKSFGIVCSFETGQLNGRPHIHKAIGGPPNLSQERLIVFICKVANRMKFRLGDIHIKPFFSDGWLEYIMKTNSAFNLNSLIISACFKPKY